MEGGEALKREISFRRLFYQRIRGREKKRRAREETLRRRCEAEFSDRKREEEAAQK